jgi:prepilin signal peptidase PulO-like enzyme (type II secretory pathway)
MVAPIMNTMLVRVLVGFALGFILSFLAVEIEKVLLKRRELEFTRVKYEKWIIPIMMGVFGSLIMWRASYSINAIYLFLLLIIGQVIILSDIHHRVIPNDTLLAILVLKLAFGIPNLLGVKGFPEFNVLQSILGLIVAFLIFAFPALIGKNIGIGDIKLAGCMGFCLGLMGSMCAIVLMGLFVVAYTFLQRKEPVLIMFKTLLPMGPFMVIGMMIVLIFGTDGMLNF